jgi:5-methylcytosine-specific restriction endonuclease McrA
MTLHAGGHRIASTLRRLSDRDGTDCARCGASIDITRSGLDPDGPTLGHVTPVVLGGSDSDANLRLEHRRCNLAAGARRDPPRATLATPIRGSIDGRYDTRRPGTRRPGTGRPRKIA